MASPSDRETAVYLAKLAEEAERYEEMLEEIKKVAKMHVDLTDDEKVMLSVGYKTVIGFRRASWRVLSSIEHKEESRGNEVNTKLIKEYKEKVETEIDNFCNDAISVVNELLSLPPTAPETIVFYQKILGDYYRYLAEFKTGYERHQASLQSFTAYDAATTTAELELPRPHPIRLGAALNYSVYFYEIMDFPQRAREVALKAFDEAMTEIDALNEEAYKDATQIMQLLRDNLVLWGDGRDENDPSKAAGDGGAPPPSKAAGDGGAPPPSKDGGDGADQAGCSDILAASDD